MPQRPTFSTAMLLAGLLVVGGAAGGINGTRAWAAGDLFEEGSQIRPLTREDCQNAVSALRDRAEATGQMMQVDSAIQNAELLCQAGDYGEAEVLLEQTRAELARLDLTGC